ncbi:DUF732 domain-containing protein [Actinoplanes sp. DH11]|uniref:DUF732 domain-containing protein n=1 Tax=Actinoplanes sp. DH11 TaxID=2857011 RepID=UPI001E555C33|nr:DUF732 domain-containing protein [Actinoplanes sp. DH11]
MRRAGLVLLAAAAVPAVTGCGAPQPVPQWKEAAPAVTSPAPSPSASLTVRLVPSPAVSASLGSAASPSAPGAPAVLEPVWPAPAPSAGFVAAVRTEIPAVALDLRPEEISELGDQACQGLAAGKRRVVVAKSLGEYGLSTPDARELVRLARSHLCHT